MRVFLVNGIRCFTNDQLADAVANSSPPISIEVMEINNLQVQLFQLQTAIRERRKINTVKLLRDIVHKDAAGYPVLSLFEAKCIADATFGEIKL